VTLDLDSRSPEGADAVRLVVTSPGGPEETIDSSAHDVRIIAPPAIDTDLAMQHGVFDDVLDEGGDTWPMVRRALDPSAARQSPRLGSPVPWLPDPLADSWVLHPVDSPPAPFERHKRGRWAEPLGHEARAWPDYHPMRLELATARRSGWSENAEGVAVELAPADRWTLELSSAPHSADTDTLELLHWVGESSGAVVRNQITNGRQPHITPAAVLQLIHAVQRPLMRPVVTAAIHRSLGEAHALLVADAPPNVHAASTAQVEVQATWSDSTATFEAGREQQIVLGTIQVPLTGGAEWPQPRHEFGDTRRRRVTCQLRAVSRFSEYFPGLMDADPDCFVTVGEPFEVDVPSSAPPSPPTVNHVTPALRRDSSLPPPDWTDWECHRQGGILRLELGPSWFQTGPGEMLAVVVSGPFPHRAMWPFLSKAGRDPTLPSASATLPVD
jgi:hypothetical protein